MRGKERQFRLLLNFKPPIGCQLCRWMWIKIVQDFDLRMFSRWVDRNLKITSILMDLSRLSFHSFIATTEWSNSLWLRCCCCISDSRWVVLLSVSFLLSKWNFQVAEFKIDKVWVESVNFNLMNGTFDVGRYPNALYYINMDFVLFKEFVKINVSFYNFSVLQWHFAISRASSVCPFLKEVTSTVKPSFLRQKSTTAITAWYWSHFLGKFSSKTWWRQLSFLWNVLTEQATIWWKISLSIFLTGCHCQTKLTFACRLGLSAKSLAPKSSLKWRL